MLIMLRFYQTIDTDIDTEIAIDIDIDRYIDENYGGNDNDDEHKR